jgi:L-seryl-tRNA(Ser) seleniumtransferase
MPAATIEISESQAYLGSGSLPTEAIPSFMVTVILPKMSATELARRLRLDRAGIFGRIENDRVCLDVRTLTDEQVPRIAAAMGRIGGNAKG